MQFSFTQDRLPGDRQVGTSIAQMLAAIGIDAQANAQPAAVFFPARTRGEYSMSMSGWGTLTGEAHYTLSSLAHSNDKDKKMGAFNVLGYKNPAMDKLLQDAAVEMDEAKRRKLLEDAERAARKGPSAPAHRRGRLGLGDAEGQGDDQGAGRRGHAGDEHQACEVSALADIAIGLHGGCGTLAAQPAERSRVGARAGRIWPTRCARAGEILQRGGSALDAVQAAVVVMEDSPHFNAGHGAALNEAAEHELDASIMDGATLAAGAVCTVRRMTQSR